MIIKTRLKIHIFKNYDCHYVEILINIAILNETGEAFNKK